MATTLSQTAALGLQFQPQEPRAAVTTLRVALATGTDAQAADISELQAAFALRSYTVTTQTTAAMAQGTMEANTVVAVVGAALNDTTLRDKLNGAGRPVVLFWSNLDGATYAPGTTIGGLLGVIANEQSVNSGGSTNPLTIATGYRAARITSGFFPGTTVQIYDNTADDISVLPNARTHFAGTALLNEATTGRACMLAVERGDSKIAAITGTFTERVVWAPCIHPELGLTGQGSLLANLCIEWAAGNYHSREFV